MNVPVSSAQSKARAKAREQLAVLGLAFRLDELDLSELAYVQVADKAMALAKHMRYDEPAPKGCSVYIYEMESAPDLAGWIRDCHKVERPYWFPKVLLNDLRDLQLTLDDLSLLKCAPDADSEPDLCIRVRKK
jgi:hypothetical protein